MPATNLQLAFLISPPLSHPAHYKYDMGLHIYIILLYIMVRLGGFQLRSKRADPEPEQAELIFVAPPAPPSHK